MFFPGLAITVTVLAFNLLGDGIRDLLAPPFSPAFLRTLSGSSTPARSSAGGPAPAAASAR